MTNDRFHVTYHWCGALHLQVSDLAKDRSLCYDDGGTADGSHGCLLLLGVSVKVLGGLMSDLRNADLYTAGEQIVHYPMQNASVPEADIPPPVHTSGDVIRDNEFRCAERRPKEPYMDSLQTKYVNCFDRYLSKPFVFG